MIHRWVFFKSKSLNQSAPSKINLKNYDRLLEIVTNSRGEAATIWATASKSDDPELQSLPRLDVGDIILDKRKKEYHIFTPIGLWSTVEVIK